MVTDNVTVVGHGKQSVYVYYYEHYHHYRETYYWPCKIGMSKKSVVKRIKEQLKTAVPEVPTLSLVIKTDTAYLLEQALHAILAVKGRQLENSPGLEWYNTTPDEVLTICQTLCLIA